MSFTLDQLKTAIQDYAENTEATFVTQLPTFIKNAEQRIFTETQLSIFRKNVQGVFTTSSEYLGFPLDYLSAYSLSITNGTEKEFLLRKNVTFVQAVNPTNATGTPKYYSQFDNANIIVAPTPDSNYTVELNYNYRPASLTAGAGGATTWLSVNAPLALLYGSLYEAYTFMKGEQDLLTNYQQRYAEALGRLKVQGEWDEVTDAYRMGLVMNNGRA
tara:strand:+ start:3719 stop:4366 length:648 start_codon:yes stop_codon:yes gene_type:complete